MATHPSTESHSTGRPPFWRRKWIVDGPLQWNLIARSLTQTSITLVLIAAGIFAPLVARMLEPSKANVDDPAVVMLYMHSRFWWIAGACLLLTALSALFLSHRIAGPLVRFKRNLRWLAEGRLPADLRTRDNDHLKTEVECLNAAVAGITERLAAVRTAQRELQVALTTCHTELTTGTEAAARTALQQVRSCADRVDATLAAFTAAGDVDSRSVTTAVTATQTIPATN